MWAFLQANYVYLIGIVLFILNEVIAANPNLKSNSLLQALMGFLGSFGPKAVVPPKQ